MSNSSLSRVDRPQSQYYEGLEIGAVSVKWVRRSSNGENVSEVIRHEGSPQEKIQEIFKQYNVDKNSKIVITGQATSSFLNLPYLSEIECLEKALSFFNIKPDILLSLGGETFSVYPLKNGIIKNIISTSKCAAGTGEFIVQQLQRMGLTIEEGIKLSSKGNFTQLATRCSVHCKSDATHKLNKGECSPADIAKTLIYNLAKKVCEMIELAQSPTGKIVIAGGVALNEILVDNLRGLLKDSEIIVLPESPYLEVFGASLFASELNESVKDLEDWFNSSKVEFKTHEPLKNAEHLLEYRVNLKSKREIKKGEKYILGVDAGSTTTKAVLFNINDNSIGASAYLRTLGNPILATKNCLIELLDQVGDKPIEIIQSGVTGSAREMVSVYLDNCRSFNEILAHARAATEEFPNVDTVFEIGGQDSKFISFLKGVPIDYAMNEGCSAGTGSFLEESTSVDMGIPVEEISDLALKSESPIAFGERCAAFINTDLRNALQQGANQEDVVGGLVYSIADNYISRIVGPRQIGENLLFLGGVALNRSVALAIAARSQQKVFVPSHPELMGSVGNALMVRDRLEKGIIFERDFDLRNLAQGEMVLKNLFRCKACENNCEIQNISIRGKVYPFGGVCSKYRLLRQKGGKVREGQDLVSLRNDLMYNEFGPRSVENPRGSIGLPMSLTTHALFPLYTKYINELGFNVVLSTPTQLSDNKTLAAVCYPCELIHGAIRDLLRKNVDFILLPRVIDFEIPEGQLHSYTCSSTVMIGDIIRAAFEKDNSKILSPLLGLSDDLRFASLNELGKIAECLGLSNELGIQAGKRAFKHYLSYRDTYLKLGNKKLKTLVKQPTVIIAGRPYVIYPPDVNLALPRKIISRGYNVIPADMLPLLNSSEKSNRNVWSFTQQIDNAVELTKNYPNLYICLISCFSCGPDAIMYHQFRQNLAGTTFCYLEIDSHTAHAGFETRVGAFLDIIEERRQKFK
ncbi:MAG: acyl-CoA dehydratase activase [Promethearchaeota archaeon]|jgi:predicted CoA-substrate-specific enzyme activase